ncbi:NAD(P)-binding protein [Patellaria atrata CBS 101060]|uniref:NAD(P)-binding protein n=1 Tax=Patellaria atrata CBS 101060 TaxID=1346257 RepID=A0A9P4S154_9PEZI|nr:NAD(P)-binding protein [Patellaria atrata CBS 101060]
MTGTVLITGANSSLAIPTTRHLLFHYPELTLFLTVRRSSPDDPNTKKLLNVIEEFPTARTQLKTLDLASLRDVSTFADALSNDIAKGKYPPLVATICNAFCWSLAGGPKFSEDGYERSMAIAHLAHLNLTLRLLKSFSKEGGRILLLGSEVHWPGRSAPMERFPPAIPDNLDELIHPPKEREQDEVGKGFYRYSVAKLAVIMCMYELGRRLKETPRFHNISALAIDPGTILDSRAFQQPDVPRSWKLLLSTVLNHLQPVLRFVKPTLRRARDAGPDVAEAAVGAAFKNKSGYFVLRKESESSPETRDKERQGKLFEISLLWCGLTWKNVVDG